jgi:hypothetical protein
MKLDHEQLQQAISDVFSARGYLPKEVHVDLIVLDEGNQVIIVCDHKNQRHINVPIETNALEWPVEKLVRVIESEIDQADMEERGYV